MRRTKISLSEQEVYNIQRKPNIKVKCEEFQQVNKWYFYKPFWYKETPYNTWEVYSLKDIPEELINAILKERNKII